MDVKVYTDQKYVPLSELKEFGEEFVNATKKYRQQFLEVVQLDDLIFANVVETPKLIKKRFIKNVELKGVIDIKTNNNDFILEIAKKIVKGENFSFIKINNLEKLIKLYEANNKDLTIITNYLISKIDQINIKKTEDISKIIPGLSKNELNFINKHNINNYNYEIFDFQKLNNSSYETARKSLDKLHNLELYKKKKIGKKFIYIPTSKLIALKNGGNYAN